MTLMIAEKPLEVRSGNYRLVFPADRPFAHLMNAQSQLVAELFYLSSVDSLGGSDDTTGMGAWLVEQRPDQIVLTLHTTSSVWLDKIYRFRCFEQRIVYEIEVYGKAQVTDIHYFGGYFSGNLRWGSGFFWSGQNFTKGFNPEPNTDEEITFSPAENQKIDLLGVPVPGRGDWFFTPPPFCFAFESEASWIGLGVEAKPGDNTYTQFRYQGSRGAFHLTLACEGHFPVDGGKILPAIGIDFGEDAYEMLQKHTQALREQHFVYPPREQSKPAWWRGPIFCGWGAQCFLANQRAGRAPDFATQAHYDEFMHNLDANHLHPAIVVIDDKWQAAYGTNSIDTQKWPDLPGFIRERHAAGQKVLLWLKAWDPEGLPMEECICNAAGRPLAVDPTHPGLRRRIQECIRMLLSADGLDADGFKIDFSARIPSGPGMRLAGEAWGLELMRTYLGLIYTSAKAAKPEALVMSHTPHAYLADVVDMIRLNDINTGRPIPAAMSHRARVARIACPEALIDTDNWPMPNKTAWAEYVAMQPELGIPALYFDRGIDATGELFNEADYQLIRDTWDRYRGMIQE